MLAAQDPKAVWGWGSPALRLRSRAATAVVHIPWHFFGIGTLVNAVMPAIPGPRWLSLMAVAVLRPVCDESDARPTLSVVVPARNEREDIENAPRRLPDFRPGTDVIFVDGHSSDGAWEEIQRVLPLWDGHQGWSVRAFQQTGRGKADAVRQGFSVAAGDLLTILDTDLTMPPELLPRLCNADCQGHCDFVNGTRLVCPMEGEAMRFLNRLGNVFFAKTVSWILEIHVGDSLCGTKLFSRRDYERFVAWRNDFGDFELLFPAAVLVLGVIDVPVAYRSRTYGSTQIRRFRDGFILLRMVLTGHVRVRLGGRG